MQQDQHEKVFQYNSYTSTNTHTQNISHSVLIAAKLYKCFQQTWSHVRTHRRAANRPGFHFNMIPYTTRFMHFPIQLFMHPSSHHLPFYADNVMTLLQWKLLCPLLKMWTKEKRHNMLIRWKWTVLFDENRTYVSSSPMMKTRTYLHMILKWIFPPFNPYMTKAFRHHDQYGQYIAVFFYIFFLKIINPQVYISKMVTQTEKDSASQKWVPQRYFVISQSGKLTD